MDPFWKELKEILKLLILLEAADSALGYNSLWKEDNRDQTRKERKGQGGDGEMAELWGNAFCKLFPPVTCWKV